MHPPREFEFYVYWRRVPSGRWIRWMNVSEPTPLMAAQACRHAYIDRVLYVKVEPADAAASAAFGEKPRTYRFASKRGK